MSVGSKSDSDQNGRNVSFRQQRTKPVAELPSRTGCGPVASSTPTTTHIANGRSSRKISALTCREEKCSCRMNPLRRQGCRDMQKLETRASERPCSRERIAFSSRGLLEFLAQELGLLFLVQ
jgi:hypothetical protein